MEYFESQTLALKRIEEIHEKRNETSVPNKFEVDEIFLEFQEKAEKEELAIFKVLTNMRDKVVKSIKNGTPPPTHDDLINIVSNKYILISAYKATRKNKGSMTRAYPIPEKQFQRYSPDLQDIIVKLFKLPDGLDWEILHQISELVRSGNYPWGCSRLIFIPKPGTKKLRPLTIPPYADKIVQEAIRMVLEAIYEPIFQSLNCSFGFRAGVGVHEAISMVGERRLTNGLNKAIEGDIDAAYPTLDRKIMVKILSERIKDSKFLKLVKIKKLYNTTTEKYESTFLGIPQGGIDSPYLWNIYLLGFKGRRPILKDIKNLLKEENINRRMSRGYGKQGKILKNPPINPLYNKVDKQIIAYKSDMNRRKLPITQVRQILRNIKYFKHLKRKINYYDPNRKMLRMLYVRYADDWIILTNAPRQINEKIKAMISSWLLKNRGLKLSDDKTFITDISKDPAHFLGYQIENKSTRMVGSQLCWLKTIN